MAKGQPDFGPSAPTTTIVSISDIGELAARLGSIVTFDRRGNVVWFDDFESGIGKWYTSGNGVGYEVAISAERSRNGGFSAKLTTGDTVNKYAEILHAWYYPVLSKVGYEASFTVDTDLTSITFTEYIYDGTHLHTIALKYLPATDKLQYYDEDGNWQDLATSLDLAAATYVFHTIKIVVDLTTHKYVRVIIDNTEHGMSDINYSYGADVTAPQWYQMVTVVTGVASNQSMYVDDVIITQNEP